MLVSQTPTSEFKDNLCNPIPLSMLDIVMKMHNIVLGMLGIVLGLLNIVFSAPPYPRTI